VATGLQPAVLQGANRQVSGRDDDDISDRRARSGQAAPRPLSNAKVMIAAAGVSALFMAGLAGGATALPRKSNPYQKLAMLSRVLSYVEQSYVEDVDADELVYGAIKGMMDSLDPHSTFLRPEQYREMKNDTSGQFSGVGIEVDVRDGVLTVMAVMEGTPAARAGIQASDQILRIDDQPTRGMSDYVQRMRGKRGSAVQLAIVRRGQKDLRTLTLVRELIKVRSVDAFMLEPGYGVIKIKQFTDSVDHDVELALAGLEKESNGRLQGLVLDLRNNPGGLLDQAVRIADAFIDNGLIVRTEGRNGRILDEERAHQRGSRIDFPIICLVNGGSASAAEIVAGALQDHGRGLVMGTQTFGKGSVQTIIEMDDGSALKLTIARYFTPSGRSIQEKGISPDVVVEQVRISEMHPNNAEEPVQKERDLHGHLKNKQRDAARLRSGPPPGYTVISQHASGGEDFQLRTAYDYLKAWTILSSRLVTPPHKMGPARVAGVAIAPAPAPSQFGDRPGAAPASKFGPAPVSAPSSAGTGITTREGLGAETLEPNRSGTLGPTGTRPNQVTKDQATSR